VKESEVRPAQGETQLTTFRFLSINYDMKRLYRKRGKGKSARVCAVIGNCFDVDPY